jgi:hypothetical protein
MVFMSSLKIMKPLRPPIFCQAQRDVGLANKLRPIDPVLRRRRRAHADADMGFVAEDVERSRDDGEDVAAKTGDILRRRGARSNDREFIAAGSRQQIAFAQDSAEPARYLAQHLVAGPVTEGAVDRGEAIDREDDQRSRSGPGPDCGESVIEGVVEQRQVGQPGQGIVKGEMVRLSLARAKGHVGSPQPPHQYDDDRADESNGSSKHRPDFRENAKAGFLGLPDKVTDHVTRAGGQRIGRFRVADLVVAGKPDTGPDILIGDLVEEAAVHETNTDQKKLTAGGLLDFARIRNDRHDADHGRPVVQHDQIGHAWIGTAAIQVSGHASRRG